MPELLTQNDAERRKVNADTWHAAGYSGTGTTLVCIDDKSAPHAHMASYAESPHLDAGSVVGHGTNVAQCAHEFAPGARVVLVRSNDEGRQWIRDNAADIDVINVSRSAGRHLAEYSYGFLESFDIPVVCSSGNDGDDRVNYPSRFEWTLSIGALEEDGEMADYSNGGERLDCVAPTDIYVLNSEKRPHKFNGTSASAPATSGLLACYVQWRHKHGRGRLTTEDARQFIRENCEEIEGYAYGAGLFCLPAELPDVPESDEKSSEDREENPKEEDDEMVKEPKEFTDVPADFWAYDDIQLCVQHGLVSGYEDGSFDPNGGLTRAQYCAIKAAEIRAEQADD
ncbi:S8 family peptidase [Salibacterium lacus]|uniref:S8 family serine peptidase n=1 Tax=Salibacterium lacus TaxID=1898109 RepID=A0ABW5SZ88_9BACI